MREALTRTLISADAAKTAWSKIEDILNLDGKSADKSVDLLLGAKANFKFVNGLKNELEEFRSCLLQEGKGIFEVNFISSEKISEGIKHLFTPPPPFIRLSGHELELIKQNSDDYETPIESERALEKLYSEDELARKALDSFGGFSGHEIAEKIKKVMDRISK